MILKSIKMEHYSAPEVWVSTAEAQTMLCASTQATTEDFTGVEDITW